MIDGVGHGPMHGSAPMPVAAQGAKSSDGDSAQATAEPEDGSATASAEHLLDVLA
ncbi:MAG: hypothetical protein IIC50_13855 [Planctomycetes bacterium]|nr:hypothetical protein [Planctomycetota bacterium]